MVGGVIGYRRKREDKKKLPRCRAAVFSLFKIYGLGVSGARVVLLLCVIFFF